MTVKELKNTLRKLPRSSDREHIEAEVFQNGKRDTTGWVTAKKTKSITGRPTVLIVADMLTGID